MGGKGVCIGLRERKGRRRGGSRNVGRGQRGMLPINDP